MGVFENWHMALSAMSLAWFTQKIEDWWFSRALVLAQFYLAWDTLVWAKAFASTALAAGRDLMGTAATIGAVFVGPQALLFAATKFYMDAKARQPRIVQDRREQNAKAKPDETTTVE
jgi:hypothetical protein